MTPRPPAQFLALVVWLALPGPREASAAEHGCAAMAVEPDPDFRARFPDLSRRIKSELAASADLDQCARVTLHSDDGTDIEVSVTLPDGRSASRNVARDDDVMPTLQALLLVPEPTRSDNAPPVSAPEGATPAGLATRSPTQRPTRKLAQTDSAERPERDWSRSAAASPRQLGFELSAISGLRVGDGQFGYGAGVLSFLEVHSWLLGFEGRADGYRSISGSDPETALELALLGGKRFDFGSVALDLTAGPAIAMKGLAFSRTETVPMTGMTARVPPPPPPRSEPSSGPVPRLLVGARLGFNPRSVLRTLVGIDGELGPSRSSVDSEANVSSPRMPTFTVGLALGATVGTP